MNGNECVYDIGNNMRQAPSRANLRGGRDGSALFTSTRCHIVCSCRDLRCDSMGKKSEKKVKSERITALRKQYDAFLEEDKKRKERNEYILGRLDNMRYTSNAVQIRHKPIDYGDVMPIYNRGAYRPEQFERRDIQATHPDHQITQPTQPNLQLDVPKNYFDNTSLLKEISKKYILIPKLRTSMVNDYVATIPPQSLPPIAVSSPHPNVTNTEDWKSKYDILEQLKNKETEEEADKYGNDELYPVKEKQALPKADTTKVNNLNSDIVGRETQNTDYALQSYNTKELTTKYEQEVAEKDLTSDKVRESEPQYVERPKTSDSKDHLTEPTTDQAPSSAFAYANATYNNHNLQNQTMDNYAPVADIPANNTEQYVYEDYPNENNVAPIYAENTTEDFTKNIEHQVDVPHQEYPVQYEQPVEIEGNFPETENVYLDPDDYSPIQIQDPSAVVKPIPSEPIAPNQGKEEEEVVDSYPVDMLNVQEFTPKDDVTLIDGENINPRYYAMRDDKINTETESNQNEPATATVDEQTPEAYDPSSIEEFDAEQKEMFYSEDTPESVLEQQVANIYNLDYADLPVEEHNAAYQSAATAIQELEYPVQINEYEESNARYDQNYEQQYAAEYEQYQGQEQQYVQNEGYEQSEQNYVQPDQQYVPAEGYDQSAQQQYEGYNQNVQQYQEYEPEQVEYETVQTVQKDLDHEQGFVEQKPDADKTTVNPAQQAGDQ